MRPGLELDPIVPEIRFSDKDLGGGAVRQTVRRDFRNAAISAMG